MGQEPNIELEIQDLPRPVPHPAPPRRWSPTRPGEITEPSESPWGGAYGTPGPDTGYVLRLIHLKDPAIPEGEDDHDIAAGLAALASARASHFGRAPTTADVDIAMILLGLDPALPSDRAGGYAEFRAAALANLSHRPDRSRALVAGVPLDLLAASPSEVRARVHGGEWSPSV